MSNVGRTKAAGAGLILLLATIAWAGSRNINGVQFPGEAAMIASSLVVKEIIGPPGNQDLFVHASTPTTGQAGDCVFYTADGVDGRGGDITCHTGNGVGTNQAGGSVYYGLGGGTGTATGAEFYVQAGSSNDGVGGAINITAGQGAVGGIAHLDGGGGIAGNGGAVELNGGDATGVSGIGGAVTGTAGNGVDGGGTASLIAGDGITYGPGGLAKLWGGNGADFGAGGDAEVLGGVSPTGTGGSAYLGGNGTRHWQANPAGDFISVVGSGLLDQITGVTAPAATRLTLTVGGVGTNDNGINFVTSDAGVCWTAIRGEQGSGQTGDALDFYGGSTAGDPTRYGANLGLEGAGDGVDGAGGIFYGFGGTAIGAGDAGDVLLQGGQANGTGQGGSVSLQPGTGNTPGDIALRDSLGNLIVQVTTNGATVDGTLNAAISVVTSLTTTTHVVTTVVPVTVNATTYLDASQGSFYLLTASGGSQDVYLPDPSAFTDGVTLDLKGIATTANPITLLPFAAETIDGGASYALDVDFENVSLVVYGGNWYVK